MTTTDVPGINLDWLNVDTEQGMEIETGRKGLTLESIRRGSGSGRRAAHRQESSQSPASVAP